MYVKQISVFIENTPGMLAKFTKMLGEANIDLISLSIADTTDFGILRGIVADYKKAYDIISNAGYTIKLTDVLAISVNDTPGGLASVLEKLAEKNISLEYMYSFVRNKAGKAYIVFRVDNNDDAAKILIENGIEVLTQADVEKLENKN